MMTARQLLLAYLALVATLSLVSLTFEWSSPIEGPEGAGDWYSELGVRDGRFVLAGHEPPGGGLRFRMGPSFSPTPLYVGAGPESGGLYVAVWFPLGVVALAHMRFRAARAKRDGSKRPVPNNAT